MNNYLSPVKLRRDFNYFNENSVVYLDNAATTQKPRCVVNKLCNIYEKQNANVHRSVHSLSRGITKEFENARECVKNFINANKQEEIIFTKGTTESINLVAYSYFETFLKEGDRIIVSEAEHHSNFVVWQQLCLRRKVNMDILPVKDDGTLELEKYKTMITPNTKLVAVAYVSNALGNKNPIDKIIRIAHSNNIRVLIDGAQSVSHIPIDVQKLDCDFFCFSGHKIYGPNGIGVLYGKYNLLNEMVPFTFGGEMIDEVNCNYTKFNTLPYKFEAGTPNYPAAIALMEAIKYIETIGFEYIQKHDQGLLSYIIDELKNIEGVQILGEKNKTGGIISFVIDGISNYDLGIVLDKFNIAIRFGNHCAQPLMNALKTDGTLRVSFAIYNNCNDVDKFISAIMKAKKILKR